MSALRVRSETTRGRNCRRCGEDKWIRTSPKSWRCAPCARIISSRSHLRRVTWEPRYPLLRGAQERARRRGLDIDLDIEDIVIPDNCPALGIPLRPARGGRTAGPNSPTLDRLDNQKGYTRSNVRVISHRANVIKGNATAEELERIAAWLRKETKT